MTSWVVWITGLPGSGKSTIVKYLHSKLKMNNITFQLLSIDMLRKIVTPQAKYTSEERDIVYNSLIFSAYILSLNDINVIIDATGNLRKYREKARSMIHDFFEVYVKCPLDICIRRERQRKERYGAPKMIYDKAFKVRTNSTVPGIGAPYEEPFNPEVIIESNLLKPEDAAEKIILALKNRFYPHSRY